MQLTISKDELQQLLSEKVARKGVFLDVENPVLSLPDGKIKIDCELNPVLCPRTAATIEFSVRQGMLEDKNRGVDRGVAVIQLSQVKASVRPLGGLLGSWMFDGEWTKNKIMGAIGSAIKGRKGMHCSGDEIYIFPDELRFGLVKIIGSVRLIRVEETSVDVDIG